MLVYMHGELLSGAVIDLNHGEVAGLLKVFGGGGGSIINGGVVSGSGVCCGGVGLSGHSANIFSGTATFDSVSASGQIWTDDGGHVSGSITVTGNMSGSIYISADLTGDLEIGGDLTSSGTVTVSGALASLGRIFTSTLGEGECAGAIRVGKQTGDLTLIHCNDGLTSTGTIEINTSRGNFNAGGTIRVGLEFVPFPLPDITYDGCIRIYDKDPGNGGGALNGTISVVGCHATADALSMCIDGALNGSIDIVQTDCTNQVRPACSFGCP